MRMTEHMWHRCSAPVRSQECLDTCKFSTPSCLASPTLRSPRCPHPPWEALRSPSVVDRGKVRAVISMSGMRSAAEEKPLRCYKSQRELHLKQLCEIQTMLRTKWKRRTNNERWALREERRISWDFSILFDCTKSKIQESSLTPVPLDDSLEQRKRWRVPACGVCTYCSSAYRLFAIQSMLYSL